MKKWISVALVTILFVLNVYAMPSMPDASGKKHIIFIDPGVQDFHSLLTDVSDESLVILLDPNKDGVKEVAQHLESYRNLNSIHIISHGQTGSLKLGDSSLNYSNVDEYETPLNAWGNALSEEGDLLFYGCNVGDGANGVDFVNRLAAFTGADVAASDDLTGAKNKGGDWDLEIKHGLIEGNFAFIDQVKDHYQGVLETITFAGAGATNSGGAGFRTITDNRILIDNDLAVDALPEVYPSVGTSGQTFIFKADGTNATNFDVDEILVYSFGSPISVVTGTQIVFKDSSDNVIRTDTLTSGTIGSGASSNLASLFGSFTSVSQVASIEFTIVEISGGSLLNVTFKSLTLSNFNSVSNTSPAISIDNSNLSYTEDDSVTQMDSAATLTDSDGDADWDGGTLVAQITANNESADELSIPDNVVGNINTSGTNILDNVTTIGTLSTSEGTVTDGTALTITFNSNATNSLVQQVLRAIHYRNTSEDPGTSNRTITLTATDKNSGSSSDTRTVAFTALNDQPTLTATSSNPTFTEGGSAASVYSSASASTIESGQTLSAMELTITNVSDSTNEVLTLDGSSVQLTNGNSLTSATNSLSVSVALASTTATVSVSGGTLSTSATQTLIDGIAYSNSSENPNTSNRVITVTSLTDSGSNSGSNDNVNDGLSIASTVTVAAVNDAPTDLVLTSTSITQSATALGADVGTLSSTDVDDSSFTYTLVSNGTAANGACGAGNDADNSDFQINTATLETAGSLTAASYKICLQTNDGNTTYEEAFSITVADNVAPSISSISIPDSNHKVGDTVTATITVSSDSDDYTTGSGGISGTINSYSLGSLSRTNSTTYTATFTIVDGGTDVDAGSNVSVNMALTDSTGNASSAFTAAISQASDAIYANLPDVDLTANTNTIAEDGGASTLTATLSSSLNNQWPDNITVNLAYSGAATVNTDYTKFDSITVTSGSSTGTATITSIADTLYDAAASETIIVDISSLSEGNEGTTNQQTISITDAESAPTVSLSVGNASVAENGGTSSMTATLSHPTYANTTVNLSYSGTATSGGTDYNTPSSSITINAGSTSANAATGITGVDDGDTEGSETIIIDIASVSGGSATESGTQQQTVTMTDDEAVLASLTVSSSTIAEAAGTSTMTATLNQTTFADVIVNLSYSGTATNGSDYATSPTSITVTAGQTTGTATLTATQDSSVESSESIIVDIASVSGGAASEDGTQQQTVTVTDDDNANVSLAVSTASIAEAAGTSTITASLDQATYQDVTVNLSYTGTATSGTDYNTPNSSITISSGQTSGSATLTAIQDANEESNETIVVDISSVSGGSALENGTQSQTVSITNDDNETTADAATVNEDESVQIDVLANDVGAGAALNAASVAVVSSASNGSTSINTSDGVITYTPDDDFNGSDSFAYTVIDVQGNTSASTTVSVTVTSINDAPNTVNDTASVDEDSSVVIDVLSNDTDIDGSNEIDSSSIAISGQPSNGAVVIENNKVTYTPTANYSGSDSFSYTVSDNSGAVSASATVTINVSGMNDAPVSVADSVSTDEDSAVIISVLDNDSDVDGQLEVSTIAAVVNPSNGTVVAEINGTFTYTPSDNFNGSDSFTYTVKDDQNAVSSEATVTLTVNAVNDAPVASNDVVVLQEDTTLDINVVGNDSDIDSTLDTSSLSVSVQPSQGTVSLVNGMFRYTPNEDFDGNDSFSYTVNDVEGSTSNVASVSVTVQAVNDEPLANNDNVTTDEDTSLEITVLANDQDIDGSLDGASVSLSQPSNGSVTADGNGLVTYTPTANFSGSDSFSYTVSDDEGADSNTATVSIQVNSVNDLPTISGTPSDNVLEGGDYSFTPTLSDIENDPLTVTVLNSPGWLTLNATTGVLSGSPEVGDEGTYSNIVLQVSDGQGSTQLARFTIEVVGDFDIDGVANSEDTDDDNDGMSDEFELANGFDTFNAQDAALDADNDGLSNLNEQNAGSNPLVDDQAPIIADVSAFNVNATGLLTPIMNLVAPTANDVRDGNVDVTLVGGTIGNLAPGLHTASWSAVDGAGNQTELAQTIHVHPLISLSKDQIVGEGVEGQIQVLLNGLAPEYPITVSYEIGGSSDASDHNLTAGSVTFEQGELVKNISFNITEDQTQEASELLVVSLVGDENFGTKSSHIITIVEENVAPQVELTLSQNGQAQLIIEQSSGPVNFVADIYDPNPNDTHTVEWVFSGGGATVSISDVEQQLDPSSLVPGIYSATVTVFDNGLPPISNEVNLSYRIVEELNELSSSQDSDGDGVSDVDEGWLDDDQDGQPNYLDSSALPNVLNEVAEDGFTFLIEADPGVKMVLGERALSNDGRGAKLEPDLLPEALQIPEDDINNLSGYFDFVINELPVVGQSVNVVIPQRMAIPEDAVYRKYDGVWFTFVEDANNDVMSAPGSQGVCPPPQSDLYQTGLNEGDWCVQLTIEDGGPNDADGIANGSVIDPGGVGNLESTAISSSGSGGGSFGWSWIMVLIGMLIMKHAQFYKALGRHNRLALPLLLLLPLESKAFDWDSVTSNIESRSYLGFDMYRVISSQSESDFVNGLASDGVTVDIDSYDENRTGYQFTVGYRYLDWSAIELGYLDLGKVNVDLSATTTNTEVLENSFNDHYPVTGQGWTLGNRVEAEPLNHVIVFGEVGVFFWESDIDVDGVNIEGDDSGESDLYMGFGAGYRFNDHFTLDLKLRRIFVEQQDVDLMGFGLGLNF